MPQPARVMEVDDVCAVLSHVLHYRYPFRNQTMVLLSFKAGLRACEIAGLDWTMVLKPDGRVDALLSVTRQIAKVGSARRIPVHPDLAAALRKLHALSGKPDKGADIRSERGSRMTARSVVNWFALTYAELGYVGCSSHSGRRTFITRSARLLAKTG